MYQAVTWNCRVFGFLLNANQKKNKQTTNFPWTLATLEQVFITLQAFRRSGGSFAGLVKSK